jgi:hypothetical protein
MLSFFLKKAEAWTVLQSMLDTATGADHLTVCSFAMSEVVVKRLIRERYRIGKLTVILDMTVAKRHRANMLFTAKNVDELYLCNTHAKLIFIDNADYQAVCALSANLTMNYRYECGMMTDIPEVVREVKQCLENMKKDGQRIEFD